MMRIALLVGLVIGCGSSPPAAPVAPAIPAAGDSEVDLGLLQKGSPSQAKLARLRLIHANTLDARQKVQALSLFVDDKDREAVRILCQRTNDASIAWPCLQYGALKLESSLGLIAELPVFGYDEFRRLANTPDAARINGLRCLEAGARSEGLQPMFDRVFRSTEDVPPVLVTIYHRASRDAPEPTATCLLEEASFLCLHSILRGKTCPVLRSFADYVRRVSEKDREALITKFIQVKNDEYQLLTSGKPGTQLVLFYMHLVMAEMLVSSTVVKDTLWLPQYHVARAMGFFQFIRDAKVSFTQFLSPQLRKHVCGATAGCTETCQQSQWGRCSDACPRQIAAQDLATICTR